jgi:hypothetical protein
LDDRIERDAERVNEPALEELSRRECLQLLRLTTVGRIGVVVAAEPLVLPINFRLVEAVRDTWIIVRTRPGSVFDLAGSRAVLEIDGVDPFHRRGWSVVARGVLHQLSVDAISALEAHFDPDPWIAQDRRVWLGINVDAITGRRLGAPELQWAFHIQTFA